MNIDKLKEDMASRSLQVIQDRQAAKNSITTLHGELIDFFLNYDFDDRYEHSFLFVSKLSNRLLFSVFVWHDGELKVERPNIDCDDIDNETEIIFI